MRSTIRLILFTISLIVGWNSPHINALEKKTLHNQNHFLIHYPRTFNQENRYPILMALHGMSEYTKPTCKKWQPVADTYNYILICPIGNHHIKGYLRYPFDERKGFIEILDHYDKKHKIDLSRSILVGFSKGGNLAIETALMFPNKIKNAISIFGFYTRFNQNILKNRPNKTVFGNSNILLITGKTDPTYSSITNGHNILNDHNIRTKLVAYNHKTHSYPEPLPVFFEKAQKWLYKKKEY